MSNKGNSRGSATPPPDASTGLDPQQVDFLLHRVLRGCTKVSPEPDWAWLVAAGTLSYQGEPNDGPGFFRSAGTLVKFTGPAMDAAKVLSSLLRNRLGLSAAAAEHDIFIEVLNSIVRITTGLEAAKGMGARLLSSLPAKVARAVTIFPCAGLDLRTSNGVVSIGDRVIIGSVDEATELAISEMSQNLIGHSFHFSDDAWWTENYLALKADPNLLEDGEEGLELGVGVIACVVDAVDYVAAVRAREAAEGILGAFWLVDDAERRWRAMPPWLIGTPTRAEDPREPALGDDIALPLVGLQVDTLTRRVTDMSFETPTSAIDVATIMSGPHHGLIELVASVETSTNFNVTIARRVSAACRLLRLAGLDRSLSLTLLYCVIALEALVSDHAAGAGVTERFVRRVNVLLGSEDYEDILQFLYQMRSEMSHQGFTTTSAPEAGAAAARALDISQRAIFATLELVRDQSLGTERDYLAWLDLAAEAAGVARPPGPSR